MDSKMKRKNEIQNVDPLKPTMVDPHNPPYIKSREAFTTEKKALIKEKKMREHLQDEGQKEKEEVEWKEEQKKRKKKKEEKEMINRNHAYNIKINNKASQTYKIDTIYSTVYNAQTLSNPQNELITKNEIKKQIQENKRTHQQHKEKHPNKIVKNELKSNREKGTTIYANNDESFQYTKEVTPKQTNKESISFPKIQRNNAIVNNNNQKKETKENKINEKKEVNRDNTIAPLEDNYRPLSFDVYGFSYIPLDKSRNVRWNKTESVQSDSIILNKTKEIEASKNVIPIDSTFEAKKEKNTEIGITPYFYKQQMENDLLNYHIVNLSVSDYDQTYFGHHKKNQEPDDSPNSTVDNWGNNKKELEMKKLLKNRFQKITNFEYQVEQKLCYDCFIAQEDRCLISYKKMMSVKNYMKYEKLKKKNEYLKKCYTFTYGFYCKKGKYHNNEETSSHALFSSYKLRKEIKNLYAYIKNHPGCTLLDIMNRKLNLDSDEIVEDKKNTYIEKQQKKESTPIVGVKPSKEGENVSLKFSIPSFVYTTESKIEKGSSPYDIIYNYYLEENTENNYGKYSKRKIMNMDLNELDEKYRLKPLELKYKINEIPTLRTNEQEDKYVTFQNIKLKHSYHFICKKCNKEKHINKDKTMDVCYLNYLFDGFDFKKEKKTRKKKNTAPTDLFYGFNDSNNSSASDEYSYINYSKKYKKKKGKKRKEGTDSNKKQNIEEPQVKQNPSIKVESTDKSGKDLTIHKNPPSSLCNINVSNEERFTMNDYLIQCKKCRYANKYDNIANEYLINFCRNNSNFTYPFMLDVEREKSLYAFLHKNETTWESGYSTSLLQNHPIIYDKNKKPIRKISFSYSDLENYEKVQRQIDKEKNNKKILKEPMSHRTHINMLGSKRSELFRRKSNYDGERGIKLKLNKSIDFLKYKKRSQLIQYLSLSKKKGNNKNIDSVQKKRKDPDDGEMSIGAQRRIKSEENSNTKKEYVSSFSSIDKNIIKKETKITNSYDMHLFTICDGHGDIDTSFFMIHNIHIIFYFLLIHTFFSVHYTFKLLYPLMDYLYYKMGEEVRLNKACGSCVINLFFHKNYIYVSNIGDSKCAVLTFDLEKFEYKERTKKEQTMKGKKKEKNKKGRNKSKQKNTIRNHDETRSASDLSILNNEVSNVANTKTQYRRSTNFVINKNSISYNELNSEHNCNNYSEYLRSYKAYYHNILQSLLLKEAGEESCQDHLEAMKSSNQENKNIKNATNPVSVRTSLKELLEMKRKKKKETKLNNTILNKELHEHIINLNKFIVRKDKEFMIGNYSFDAIQSNRIFGCLHPTRVIGDYDMKRNFKNLSVLSNLSNIYKYNLENINVTNKVHYLYKNVYCDKCNQNYILSEYGRIGVLRDIILLEDKTNLNNHQTNKDNTSYNSNYIHPSTNCLKQKTALHSTSSSGPKTTTLMKNEKTNSIEKKNKEAIQKVFKMYYESGYGKMKEKSNREEKEKANLLHSEVIVPYIYEKNSNMNTNNVFRIDRRNFFHLIILASDGVFEYIQPDYVMGLISKNKPIYKKIQKIYKIYHTYTNTLSFKEEDVNVLLHKYMITKEESKRLAKEIVKGTVTKGNFDDSTCFCIFLFPTLFFPI